MAVRFFFAVHRTEGGAAPVTCVSLVPLSLYLRPLARLLDADIVAGDHERDLMMRKKDWMTHEKKRFEGTIQAGGSFVVRFFSIFAKKVYWCASITRDLIFRILLVWVVVFRLLLCFPK